MIVYNNEYNLILKHLLIRLPALYGAQLKTKHPRILTEIISDLGILTPITAYTLLACIDGCTSDFIPSYDAFISDKKLLIEANGDFWHANPRKFSANDELNLPHLGKTKAKDIWGSGC